MKKTLKILFSAIVSLTIIDIELLIGIFGLLTFLPRQISHILFWFFLMIIFIMIYSSVYLELNEKKAMARK